MATFPSQKVHRASRRKLGRGQTVDLPQAVPTVTGSASTAIVNFAVPVVVNGNLPLTVDTRTFVSQVVDSPTQVTVTVSGAVTGLSWVLLGGNTVVKTMQGAGMAGASGTFA